MTKITYEKQTTDSVDQMCDPAGYECPYAEHYADLHHIYFPRSEYRTRAEKRLRNKSECKVVICRFVHDMLHATETAPDHPSASEINETLSESRRPE